MFHRKLLQGHGVLAAMAFSISVGAGATLISYLTIGDLRDSVLTSYLGYLVVLPCLAVGLWRPFTALLSSFMLLAVNPGNAIAHGFTSAPSDYLVMAATASLIFRSFGHFKLISTPIIAALLLATSATISLAVAFNNNENPIDKVVLAEYLGMLNMACYVAAPAMAVRSVEDFRNLLNALCLGVVPLFVGGVVGSTDTLFCYTDGINQMYTTAGFRDKGLLGDPNIFGAMIASLLPVTVLAVRSFGVGWQFAAAFIGAATIVVSGSRTGITAGCLACLLALLCINRNRTWILLASCPAIGLLVVAPTMVWGALPCVVGGPADRVLFNERNAESQYLARLMIRDEGIGAVMLQSPVLMKTCVNGLGTDPRVPATFDQASVRACVLPYLERALAEPSIDQSGYKKSPIMTAVLAELPLDESRRLLWSHAAAVGIEHPLFGVGLSNLARVTPRHWRSHNTYLTAFAEQGLVGAFLLTAAIATAIFGGLQGRQGLAPREREILIAILIGIIVSLACAMAQDMIRQQNIWALLGLFAAGNCFKVRLVCPATQRVSIVSLPNEKIEDSRADCA